MRCSCGGLLKVLEWLANSLPTESSTVYECRRCKKRYEWREVKVDDPPIETCTQCGL